MTNEIKQLTDGALAQFTKAITTLINESQVIDGKIEIQKVSLADVSNQLSTLLAEKSRVELFIKEETAKLSKERAVLEQAQNEFNAGKDKRLQDISLAEKTLEDKKALIKESESKLKEVSDAVKAIEPMKVLLNNLEKNVSDMTSKINAKNDEFSAIETKHLQTIDDIQKQVKIAQEVFESIDSKNNEAMSLVSKRMDELSKREKIVKEKEDGLKIVEARWKKLYGEKDLDFKV